MDGHAVGGAPFRFDRMLDEHTATYDIYADNYSGGIDGQIAVVLPDSIPPDLGRPWKVRVIGPLTVTNVFGAKLTIVAVKFEGYSDPPASIRKKILHQKMQEQAQKDQILEAKKSQEDEQERFREEQAQAQAQKEAKAREQARILEEVQERKQAQEREQQQEQALLSKVMKGQTPAEVATILGPPASISPDGNVYNYKYPLATIMFSRGRVWSVHLFPRDTIAAEALTASRRAPQAP